MNAFDRRRIAVVSLITVSVLALVWVFSSGSSSGNDASGTTCVGCPDSAGNSAPSTTEYQPHPPLFVGGDNEVTPLDPVTIATAPEPNANEFLTTAGFVRYSDITVRRCSTMLAPESALLTVTNVDNGQSTKCTNTQGIGVPPGIGMVIHTDIFAEIGDLSDSPLPVRVSWEPAVVDNNDDNNNNDSSTTTTDDTGN